MMQLIQGHNTFTQKKFCKLTCQKQHKKAAEILRSLYESLIASLHTKVYVDEYEKICKWMSITELTNIDIESVSDRYHWHLKQASVFWKEHNLLPCVKCSDNKVASPSLDIFIYLDKIRSAHNIGSIIRTTEAFSLGTVCFAPGMAFIDNLKVRNTAMGAAEWVTCKKDMSLQDLPHPIIALEVIEEAINYYDFIFPDIFTLVLGNEEYGCSEEVLRKTDYFIKIPMVGRKNSLNVSNAYAIIAGEIRKHKPSVSYE